MIQNVIDWCILRTASSQTLNLAQSLADAEFNVWTPSEIVQKQHARRKVKREDVAAPLMPSFVFAQATRLSELVALSHSPALTYRVWDREARRMVAKGHPRFSVFRHDGRHVLVPDRALVPLRAEERRQRHKAMAKRYAQGEQVKLTEGAFEGLTGTVDRSQGSRTWVRFPGAPWSVDFPTWVLLPAIDVESPVHVGIVLSEQALSAKAA